jgi:hypothetical protein
MYEGARSRYCKKDVTGNQYHSTQIRRQLTHMPWLQRQERGDDVQTIRRQEGQDDIPEDRIPKDRIYSDAFLLYTLNTEHREVDCYVRAVLYPSRDVLTGGKEHVDCKQSEPNHRYRISDHRSDTVSRGVLPLTRHEETHTPPAYYPGRARSRAAAMPHNHTEVGY